MMIERLRVAVCSLCLALTLAVPLHAEEDTRDQARAFFDHGLVLVDREHFEEAAIQFERAYALSPRPAVLYNIAKAHAAARHVALAVAAFKSYLESAEQIPAERRQEVLTELAGLEARLGNLKITTTPSNAELRVDGRLVRAGAQYLDPGQHLVSASAVGYAPLEREVFVSVGETAELTLTLERLSKPDVSLRKVAPSVLPAVPQLTPSPKAEPHATDNAPGSTRRIWFAASTAGAGLLLAGVTVGLVVDNAARYERWQSQQNYLDAQWKSPSPGLDQQQAQNDTRANRIKLQDQIATGVGVASVACLVASLVIWFVKDEQPRDARAQSKLFPRPSGTELRLTW